MSEQEEEDGAASVRPDLYLEQLAERAGGRSVRRLRGLLADAVRLVVRAAGKELRVLVAVQILTAAVAGVQVVVARSALSTLLKANADGSAVLTALPAFAVLALLSGISAGGSALQSQRQQLVGELTTRATLDSLLDVTTRVPLETFDRPSFYDRLQRVQGNALAQPSLVVQGLLSLVGGLVGSVALTVALLSVQPVLVPILLLAGIPLFLLQRRGGRIEFAFAVEYTPLLRRRYLLSEMLMSRPAAKEIRAFGAAASLRDRYAALYDHYLVGLRRKVRTRLRIQLVSELVTALVGLAAVLVLLELVAHHEVALSSAAAAAVGIGLLGGRLAQLASGAGAILQAGLFLEDLDDFLSRSRDLPPATVAADTVTAADAFEVLQVTGVGYTYPAAKTPALAGIDLTLHRGQVLALVGENGSGKTTLSKLLANLYTPTTGTITWDGVDTAALAADDLRARTSILFQDFLHYELSLYDNVALGRPARFDDRAGVDDAIDRAGARDVVKRLPDGLETFLSPRFSGGSDLSGGQWQRVAMARALFRDAPFIVLDEPTAALDPRAEAALFDTVRTLLAGRTVVLVSHRLASVRHADQILVLVAGRIVERGTHQSLLAAGGHYAELYNLQAAGFVGER